MYRERLRVNQLHTLAHGQRLFGQGVEFRFSFDGPVSDFVFAVRADVDTPPGPDIQPGIIGGLWPASQGLEPGAVSGELADEYAFLDHTVDRSGPGFAVWIFQPKNWNGIGEYTIPVQLSSADEDFFYGIRLTVTVFGVAAVQ